MEARQPQGGRRGHHRRIYRQRCDGHDDGEFRDPGEWPSNAGRICHRRCSARVEEMSSARTLIAFSILILSASAQQKSYRAPRTPDGKPDLQGIWEAHSTASANLEAHSAALGIRAGETVIVDPPSGRIPYQPSVRDKQKENFAKRAMADPVNRCYLPGVPRANYMPYPF